MPQSFSDFSGSKGQANQPTNYVTSDGFAGVPVAPFNPNNPTFNPAAFPAGTLEFTATGIIAHAGGGKASATLLPAQTTLVTTVATAADSVQAPVAATVGAWFQVTNNTANAMQLFGQGTDTINAVAAATGVSIAAGKTANLNCFVAGAWVGPIALA